MRHATIKLSPSDNPTQEVGFDPAAVRKHESEASFVKWGKENKFWDGHSEQEALLKDVWGIATEDESPAPGKQPRVPANTAAAQPPAKASAEDK